MLPEDVASLEADERGQLQDHLEPPSLEIAHLPTESKLVLLAR